MKITTVTIKQMPEEIHRTIKRIQLDLEEEEDRKTLEEIYIMLLNKGLLVHFEERKKKNKK